MTKEYPTIIVCVDNSKASEVALRYACYKAKIMGFSVQILAAMEASHKNLLFGSRAIGNEKRKQLEQHLKEMIDSICVEIGIVPSISIREGEVITEIINEIKSVPCCAALVFGKSNKRMSDNSILPKIIQKISDRINVPVTVVPETMDDTFLRKMV